MGVCAGVPLNGDWLIGNQSITDRRSQFEYCYVIGWTLFYFGYFYKHLWVFKVGFGCKRFLCRALICTELFKVIFTLYPVYSRIDREKLVSKLYSLFFTWIRNIVTWVAKLNAAFCFTSEGNEPTAIALTIL